jgi:hypothetical protein
VTRDVGGKDLRIHRILQDSIKAKIAIERTYTIFPAARGTTNLVRRHDTSLPKSHERGFPHALNLRRVFEKLRKDSERRCNLQLSALQNEAGWHVNPIF